MNQVEVFKKLYSPQRQQSGGSGEGLQYYRSTYRRQRGEGLGSIFGSLARRIIPFVKSHIVPLAKKYILPHAHKGVTDLVSDVFEGKNVKQSVKERGRQVFKDISSPGNHQSGGGRKRKLSQKVGSCKKQKLPCTKISTILDST